MAAPKIVPIVEGHGEVDAVPALLSRALLHFERYDIFAAASLNAHGRGNLTSLNGLERLLEVAYRQPNCAGVLVLLDSEGECPKELAQTLTARIRQHGARFPTVLVLAHTMYEVWFVACASLLAGQTVGNRDAFAGDLQTPLDPETIKDAKSWIDSQMPRSRPYKETEDQVALTRLIDFEVASANSRSFRRLLHAVEELLEAIDRGETTITPVESAEMN